MLADDFYRLSHHDATGKPRLHPRAIELGCAAAILAELISSRHIGIETEQIQVLDRRPPADSLMHVILDQLMAEVARAHTVRTWLAFLGQQAPEQIAQRLLRAGHVRLQAQRRLGRQVGLLYVPVDMNTAYAPCASLSYRLRRHEPLEYESLCLAGLALASGLDTFILDGAPAETFEYLNHAVRTLWPPMRALLFHTHAAIGGAVLAHRT